MDKVIRVVGLIAALVLVGCGGSGGGGQELAVETTMKGTVATGAPMVGASVEVFNASGSLGKATTDSNGDYTTTAFTGVGPYVIKATLGAKTLYSVQSEADGKPVNVTPLSNLVATMLSPSGNPENLSTELKTDKTIISAANVSAKKDIVKDIVSPVAEGLGIEFDVINTAMKADGTGIDKVLDTVRVSVTPAASGDASIQVAFLKGNVADTKEINLSSKSTAASVKESVKSIPKFKEKEFVDNKIHKGIKLWAERTNKCVRIPAADRWELVNNVKQFKETATDCKKLWLNNDPNTVSFTGYKAQDIFVAEFGERTYVQDALNEPEFVGTYTVNNTVNHLVKAKAMLFDSEQRQYFVYYFINLVEDSANDNELRIGGNNFSHQTDVAFNNYIYDFPSTPGYDFTVSGYDFYIPRLGTSGDQFKSARPYQQQVESAIVTWPDGITKTYLKDSGKSRNQLSVCSGPAGSECSTTVDTSLVSIRSDFYDKATDLVKKPIDKSFEAGKRTTARVKPTEFLDFGYKFDLSEEQIRNSKMFGFFTFELTIKDSTSKIIQKVPYFGRPKTHAEIMGSKTIYPKLTEATIKDFVVEPKYKVILPFKKDSQGTVLVDSIGKYDLKWDGLVQWVYSYGYRGPNGGTAGTEDNFISTTGNIKSSARELSLACTYLSSRSLEKQCFNPQDNSNSLFAAGSDLQKNATHYSGLIVLELGNYFSDFGTSIRGYHFTNPFLDLEN